MSRRTGRSRPGLAALLAGAALVAGVPAHAEEPAPAGSTDAEEPARTDTPRPQAEAPPPPPAPPAKPDSGPIDVKLVVSQFVDAPVAGDAPSTLRYAGRADAYVDVKGRAFGLDDSWTLTLRPEFTWGKTSNGEIGLIPNNTALFRGEGAGDFDLSASVSKRWNSGTKLTVGKVNILDLAGQLPVVGSNGHYGFQNLSLALPPSAIIPNTITGALLEVPTEGALYRLWVFDPASQYERTGFETAFEDGVAFLGSVTFPVKLGGKPGFYALKLSGSTRSEIAADNLPAALIPPPGTSFGNTRGEFGAVLAAYQYLGVWPEAPGKGWGIFGQIHGTLGDPTFLDASGFIGVSGNPRKRPQDRFGAAYFRYSLTDELVEVLANRVGLEDEEGVEVFYTFGLAKGVELTANAQWIDGAITARDDGVVTGLRLTTAF
ncbi:carbohydrate porin [Erythrobacter sp.]|uniref:carbohydrate porin n=1 Tax=Erythrobacter sp. TaxID=1042 RepID=UPI001425FDB7|nr:carbohydrate porin [Erythrobacter sp.]QIQ87332.1 MAG: carbohydrate porin [Erythrobacter sp.]